MNGCLIKLEKIKSTERLPPEINAVRTYFVDPSHWQRVYGSALYKLEAVLKGMNKTDVECLIQNFGYAVKQNREKCEVDFAKAMKAALKHHFDNHQYCNPLWCHFRDDLEKKSADTVHAKLRNLSDPVNNAV